MSFRAPGERPLPPWFTVRWKNLVSLPAREWLFREGRSRRPYMNPRTPVVRYDRVAGQWVPITYTGPSEGELLRYASTRGAPGIDSAVVRAHMDPNGRREFTRLPTQRTWTCIFCRTVLLNRGAFRAHLRSHNGEYSMRVSMPCERRPSNEPMTSQCKRCGAAVLRAWSAGLRRPVDLDLEARSEVRLRSFTTSAPYYFYIPRRLIPWYAHECS